MFVQIVIAIFLVIEGPIAILGGSLPTTATAGIQGNSPSVPNSPVPSANVNISGAPTSNTSVLNQVNSPTPVSPIPGSPVPSTNVNYPGAIIS